ncbi:hypothetical protein B7P43_G06878 [Cryptotermes secundus]|uniref:HAT C-terminal dimerisation domain-containing protein n=1 Tax=Cryptotermes secundus TaxID=105785 RepID=A0A2J7R339_9NEOP|nr:hypothetical protein B7P43_G06878 [Cryptotermes secundus]
MALNVLLPFSTTYLCELGFSTLREIKTSNRERLKYIDEEMGTLSSEVKRPGHEADHSSPSNAEVKNGVIPPIPHTSSWRIA